MNADHVADFWIIRKNNLLPTHVRNYGHNKQLRQSKCYHKYWDLDLTASQVHSL